METQVRPEQEEVVFVNMEPNPVPAIGVNHFWLNNMGINLLLDCRLIVPGMDALNRAGKTGNVVAQIAEDSILASKPLARLHGEHSAFLSLAILILRVLKVPKDVVLEMLSHSEAP